jgi:hypothetical protein
VRKKRREFIAPGLVGLETPVVGHGPNQAAPLGEAESSSPLSAMTVAHQCI